MIHWLPGPTGLQSLLVWSPGQRDIIKTVALVLMVLDHANRILHLDQSWMFSGRAWGLSAVCPVWGLNLSRHTHIRQEAINRLWGWAVIAQFAYYLAGFLWYGEYPVCLCSCGTGADMV